MFESHLKPPITFPTLTGSIVTFNSQYAGLPLKSHVVTIPPILTGISSLVVRNVDTTYTIQIGSTVYGGYYDAITGLFTITHARLDMGTFTWYYNSSFNRFTTNGIQSTSKYPAASEVPNMVCDFFDVVSFDDFRDYSSVNHVLALGTTGNISARATEYGTDENAFTTAMSGKYITYELANTTTIQLVPVRVETLLGENNIWADTADTTLQYIKLG